MDCPVCNKKDIGDNNSNCPQCDVNLKPYNLVNELKVEVEGFETYPKLKKYLNFLFGLFVALLVIALIYTFNQKEGVFRTNNNLKDSILVLERNLAALKDKDINNNSSKFFKYIVRKGDTLWKIARRFYGVGGLYSRIVNDNNLNDTDLMINQVLKIYSY